MKNFIVGKKHLVILLMLISLTMFAACNSISYHKSKMDKVLLRMKNGESDDFPKFAYHRDKLAQLGYHTDFQYLLGNEYLSQNVSLFWRRLSSMSNPTLLMRRVGKQTEVSVWLKQSDVDSFDKLFTKLAKDCNIHIVDKPQSRSH